MKDTNETERLDVVGEWINLLSIHELHSDMVDGIIHYNDYRKRILEDVNQVRCGLGLRMYSNKQLDELWQYSMLAHDSWEIASAHFRAGVSGWW